MQKLEENLAYDRKIISDLQAVSIVYKSIKIIKNLLRERERQREERIAFVRVIPLLTAIFIKSIKLMQLSQGIF